MLFGYTEKAIPLDVAAQLDYSLKHFTKLRKQFINSYHREPMVSELFMMWNTGVGGLHSDNAKIYLKKSLANYTTLFGLQGDVA